MPAFVRFAALTSLGLGAVVWDLRTRRIPNALTYPVALIGILVAIVERGTPGGGWALAGLAVGGGIFLPTYLMGHVGAGDLKLLAAAGALLGPFGALRAALTGAILGGVWAIGWLVAKGRTKSVFPYAPPLAVGVMISIFL